MMMWSGLHESDVRNNRIQLQKKSKPKYYGVAKYKVPNGKVEEEINYRMSNALEFGTLLAEQRV